MLSIKARLGGPLHSDDSPSKLDLLEYTDVSRTSVSTTVPVDNDATPTGILVVLPPGEEVHNDQLTRWIVDPGSNTHVFNSET